MGSIGYSDYTMLIVNYLLTECEVIAGKSQTEALTCIDRAITDRAIARSIHQGQGLRFPCSDRTDEVNKLFIIILDLSLRSIKPTTGQSITVKHMSPQPGCTLELAIQSGDIGQRIPF